MVLVQKWPFFHVFFKCNIDQENVFQEILERKLPFYSINTEVQKVKKLRFSQRGQIMVLVKKWPFFQFFFLSNIGQENVFYDILER